MEFSFTRIINLIVRYAAIHGKSFITIISAISGGILLISWLSNIGKPETDYNTMVYLFYVAVFISGFWFSSYIFSELHKPSKAYKYLTLPASNIEKLVSSWLISSVGTVVISFIFINLTSLALAVLCKFIFGIDFKLLYINEDYRFWEIILKFIILQPLFLSGAIVFSKNNFFKTILWLLLFAFTMALVSFLFTYLILPGEFRFQSNSFEDIPALIDFFEGPVVKASEFVLTYVIGPFFLIVSYFKLKESEI